MRQGCAFEVEGMWGLGSMNFLFCLSFSSLALSEITMLVGWVEGVFILKYVHLLHELHESFNL